MHRRETVPAVPGAVGGQSPHGEGSQGFGRRPDRHEIRDQKIRETSDAMDKQSFPQIRRQTGEPAAFRIRRSRNGMGGSPKRV